MRPGGRHTQHQKAIPHGTPEAGAGIGARDDTDERDADLDTGQEPPWLRRKQQRRLRTLAPRRRQSLKPGLPRRHGRRTRPREYALQANTAEEQRYKQPGKWPRWEKAR